ncbi:MAG: flippase-like domain-containing protein [Acidobacteria bacterium]|nr:flippase-like domain-containing protein [Acidobacteriota bacterium]
MSERVEVAPVAPAAGRGLGSRSVIFGLKLLLSAALIGWILRKTDLSEIAAAFRTAHPGLLLAALALHLVGYLITAQRWRLLLRVQAIDVPLAYLVRSYVISIFFNNLLPSTIGGDVYRAYDSWRVGRKAGAVAVVMVDRFLGMLVLLLFAVGALAGSERLGLRVPLLQLWLLIAIGGAFAALWLVFAPASPLARLGARLNWLPGRALRGKLLGTLQLFHGRRDVLAAALGLSVLLQANVVIHYYLVACAFDLPIPLLAFFLVIPVAVVVMMLPVTINGIGVREHLFVFFFAPFGVGAGEAVAFAWAVYGMVLLQGVAGGTLYALRRA